MKRSAPSARRVRAVESFQSAAECIGPIEPGLSLFAITRGQFSMIDAILACLDQVGPARISLWTWTVASYEIECLTRLRLDDRITAGRLIIDTNAPKKQPALLDQWQESFGPDSVRIVVNHSKIATIETDTYRLLLRGSMNLNFNPRFEQFDVTEGGPDFDLVRSIEDGLPIHSGSDAEAYKASQVANAFSPETLTLFRGITKWAK